MHKSENAPVVNVRLMGAPQTGKTQLSQALKAALSGGYHGARFAIHDSPPLPTTPANPGDKSIVLLMGLDLPSSPAASASQQYADQALREALAQARMTYQVVYGNGAERLQSALQAFQAWQLGLATGAKLTATPDDDLARWVWSCDNCSDPQCERRLLSDLLAAR